jgi:molybdenum cofactor guanylyltransferase
MNRVAADVSPLILWRSLSRLTSGATRSLRLMHAKKEPFAARPRFEICVLAGGLSSRLGKDKSRLRLGGRTLLQHVRAAARATGLPTRVIREDRVSRCGPLGGVYTALATSRADALLFLPCDMPFVSSKLLLSLMQRLNTRNTALFVKHNGRIGFPFLLRRSTLPAVQRQLTARNFSLQELAGELRGKNVCLSPRQAVELFNINTPAEWQTARDRWHAAKKE